MEKFILFALSPEKLMYTFFLLWGLLAVTVPRFFFVIKAKKLKEAAFLATSPDKRKLLEDRVSGLRMVVKLILFLGIGFCVFGLFGLIR